MTDFTNYDKLQLEGLLMLLINDTTEAVTEETTKGDTKTTVSPVFTIGLGFDTESTTIYTDDSKEQIKDCFCYSYQVAIGPHHYAIYRTLEQFLEFLEILQDVIHYKNMGMVSPAKLYIWVANLAHEWSFIKYAITDRFECTKIFAKTARDPLFIEFGDIQFRECIGLFGHSLKHIASNWTTTQKAVGDLDYDLIRTSYTPLTETEKGYCINDVVILAEMHESVLQKYIQDNGALRIPYTSSGFVRMKLKENIRNNENLTEERLNRYFKKPPKTNVELLMKNNHCIFANEVQWLLCREYGYSGGLCGTNIKYLGKELKNVFCADLTSDYPAQILHEKFPCGKIREFSHRQYSRIKAEKRPYFLLCIVDFESKTNHATFSKHKIINYKNDTWCKKYGPPKEMIIYNGKVLRCKNAICVLNDIDISAYCMIYDLKIIPLKVWAFDKYAPAPDYLFKTILSFYINKAELKAQGLTKTIEYSDSKRDVNGVYGVLLTRAQDAFDTFCENGLFKNSKQKSLKAQFWECWLNPYIGMWCTSYARRILQYYISKYPDNIIQYDTDSLYFLPTKDVKAETIIADLKKYNVHQEKINHKIFKGQDNIQLLLDLGCWDIDKPYDKFLPMGAKKYIKMQGDKVETVIAGLPKDSIPKEIEAKKIQNPLAYYNVMKKWLKTDDNKIIIDHLFAHKFASKYDDTRTTYKVNITDYQGNTSEQICGSYHAITPIDFTLKVSEEFLKHAIKVCEKELGLDKKPLD